MREWGSGAILWLLSENLWSLIHSYLGAGINVMEGRRKLIQVHCIACYLFKALFKLSFLFFFFFEVAGVVENWAFRTGLPWQENKWKKLVYLHMLEQQLSSHLSWVLVATLNETNMFVQALPSAVAKVKCAYGTWSLGAECHSSSRPEVTADTMFVSHAYVVTSILT